MKSIFPNLDAARVHHYGDVTLCAPHVALMSDYGYHSKGTLLVPLEKSSKLTRCFVPCGGPDADSGMVPGWVETLSICDLWRVKEERLPNLEKGKLFADIEKKIHDFFTCGPNLVQVGDRIAFRGETVTAKGVSVSFNGDHEAVVNIGKVFEKAHKVQTFKIIRFPKVKGTILSFPNHILKMDCPISVTHINSNRFPNVGDLKVEYKNFIFNSLGFLTHDPFITV